MTLLQVLDATGLVVLAVQAVWILLLYRRMGRLRIALEGAGDVIGQLDDASRRLDLSAGGIVQKVKDGIAEVDSKILTCRRLAQDLTAASRQAEDVAARLDQALKMNRKLQTARAATPPRELVEPLGLAERLAAPRPAPAAPELTELLAPTAPLPAPRPEPVLAPGALMGRGYAAAAPALDALAEDELALGQTTLAEARALHQALAPEPAPMPPLARGPAPARMPSPMPSPLREMLEAELLFAGAVEALPRSERTIRVKLD